MDCQAECSLLSESLGATPDYQESHGCALACLMPVVLSWVVNVCFLGMGGLFNLNFGNLSNYPRPVHHWVKNQYCTVPSKSITYNTMEYQGI